MKSSLLVILVLLYTVFSKEPKEHNFFPNLPVGEYNLTFKSIEQCKDSRADYKIKMNYYLSKVSQDKTEIKGNTTYLTPLDDSLDIGFNMAVKDSIGGWKTNAYFATFPKACSSLKFFMGDQWLYLLKKLGAHNVTQCPIPKGVYVLNISTDRNPRVKLPKTFFYGTYQFRLFMSKKEEVYGCLIFVLEVKRPWEKD